MRSAFLSVDTNFPVASTVKSSHCSTTTAALPSPKWFRSTRFAATSQSGTESARLTRPGCAQSSRITPVRHEPAATARLLPAKNHDFLIIFGNLIEELPGTQIFHICQQQRLFQIIGSCAGDCVSALRAGVRKPSEIIFNFYFFRQLLNFDFRRQFPFAGADAFFRSIEAHGGMALGGLEEGGVVLVIHPGIQQKLARAASVHELLLHMGLNDKGLRGVADIGM